MRCMHAVTKRGDQSVECQSEIVSWKSIEHHLLLTWISCWKFTRVCEYSECVAKHGPSSLTLHYSQTNPPSYTQSKKKTVLNTLATHNRMNIYISHDLKNQACWDYNIIASQKAPNKMCFKMEQTLESMECLSKHITLHYVQYPKDLHNSAPGIAIDDDRDDIGSPLIPSSIV